MRPSTTSPYVIGYAPVMCEKENVHVVINCLKILQFSIYNAFFVINDQILRGCVSCLSVILSCLFFVTV